MRELLGQFQWKFLSDQRHGPAASVSLPETYLPFSYPISSSAPWQSQEEAGEDNFDQVEERLFSFLFQFFTTGNKRMVTIAPPARFWLWYSGGSGIPLSPSQAGEKQPACSLCNMMCWTKSKIESGGKIDQPCEFPECMEGEKAGSEMGSAWI